MKCLKLLMLPLSLFLMVGCEDEAEAFDCTKAQSDLAAHSFPAYTLAYTDAAIAGTTYEFPSDWSSQCDGYYDDLQKAVDEGCMDDITSQEITDGRALCTINGG